MLTLAGRDALDFDGAFGQKGGKGADSRKHRRQNDANNPDRQRELRHRARTLLDHDTPHIPFMRKLFGSIKQLPALDFDRFPTCVLRHCLASVDFSFRRCR